MVHYIHLSQQKDFSLLLLTPTVALRGVWVPLKKSGGNDNIVCVWFTSRPGYVLYMHRLSISAPGSQQKSLRLRVQGCGVACFSCVLATSSAGGLTDSYPAARTGTSGYHWDLLRPDFAPCLYLRCKGPVSPKLRHLRNLSMWGSSLFLSSVPC